MARFFFTLVVGLTVALGIAPLVVAEPQPHVILITLDGFPAYLLEDAHASLPTLRALARRGTVAEGMTVSNPSVTWPNHTTLVTGVRPSRHSVLFNGILVRGEPGLPVHVEPAHDQAELVAVPTVFDLLHQVGLSTAGIDWPCTRNSASLDINFPDVPQQVKYMTAPLREEMTAAGVLPESGDSAFKLLSAPAHDEIWCDAACRVIRESKPNFLMLHLLNLDGTHHKYGPQTPAGYTAAALIDSQVRQVMQAVEAAGLLEQTTVFILADHGFKTATKVLLPNVLFRDAGLLLASPVGVLKARAQAISEGGTALIYLNDPKSAAEDREKVIQLLRGKEGIAAIIEPKDYGKLGLPIPLASPQAPDLVIAAADGYAFDGSAAGDDFMIAVVPGRHFVGNHGYLSDDPKMRALFIATGPHIRVGQRIGLIENVDIAPTIAHLFGQEMPNVEGKVLTQIFVEK